MELSCYIVIVLSLSLLCSASACSNGECLLGDACSSNADCGTGLYCFKCEPELSGPKCVRYNVSDPFTVLNNTMPFNKYAYLTTHNAFAIDSEPSQTGVPRITTDSQEDTVTQQLKEPLLDTLKEIEAFLSKNPTEIVTIILEDYVEAPNGLTKVFNQSGLLNYWFPVSKMPQNGEDWPTVRDMVAQNHRLLVFTSMKSKEQSEGIAYQWKYMVENQYGDDGMVAGKCVNRTESPSLNDTTKSLVLVNYFPTLPVKSFSCLENSNGLTDMLDTCYNAAGHRWANFLAVNYYKRSNGGGTLEATDMLNGRLLCGSDDVNSC